jgi:hypothetical protein
MFLLGFTMPWGRYVDYLRQFLIFRPRKFDDQSRARCPEAIAHHLDENQKLQSMIVHQTSPFPRSGTIHIAPPTEPQEERYHNVGTPTSQCSHARVRAFW